MTMNVLVSKPERDKFRAVTWLHFDNSHRYQVFGDGDAHYQVRLDGIHVILETIAADYAAMKAIQLNKGE